MCERGWPAPESAPLTSLCCLVLRGAAVPGAACTWGLGFDWGGPSMRLQSPAWLQAAHLAQGRTWSQRAVVSSWRRRGKQALGRRSPRKQGRCRPRTEGWRGGAELRAQALESAGLDSHPASASAISYTQPLGRSLNASLLSFPICKVGACAPQKCVGPERSQPVLGTL